MGKSRTARAGELINYSTYVHTELIGDWRPHEKFVAPADRRRRARCCRSMRERGLKDLWGRRQRYVFLRAACRVEGESWEHSAASAATDDMERAQSEQRCGATQPG